MHEINEQKSIKKGKIVMAAGAGGKTSILLDIADRLTKKGQYVAITTTTHIQHIDVMKKTGIEPIWPYVEAFEYDEALKKRDETRCIITGVYDKEESKNKIGSVSEKWIMWLSEHFDMVLVEADGAGRMPVKMFRNHEPAIIRQADYVLICIGMSGLYQKMGDVCFHSEYIENLLNKDKDDVLTVNDYEKIIISENGLYERVKRLLSPKTDDEALEKCRVIFNQVNTLLRKEAACRLQKSLWEKLHLKSNIMDCCVYKTTLKNFAMIFLAAGNSVRFGENKLLYPFKGKPMAHYILDEAKDIRAKKILVTQYESLAEYAKELSYDAVINNQPQRGISFSIRLGIEKAGDVDGYLFCVCDQPYLKRRTIEDMLILADISEKGIIAAVYNEDKNTQDIGKNLGNPNIFSKKYREELLSLEGDFGGKKVIKKHMNDVAMWQIPAAEAKDIDTKDFCE